MASAGKRSRDSPFEEPFNFVPEEQSPTGRAGTFDTIPRLPRTAVHGHRTRHTTPSSDTTDTSKTKRTADDENDELATKQKRFLQLWYEDFAQLNIDSSLSSDYMTALAKVIHTEPRLVFDFIDQRRKSIHQTGQSSGLGDNVRRLSQSSEALRGSDGSPSTEANDHLPPMTLNLVEKYVFACRRRRAQTDGRRSVNQGPFRCTFGCGYRTKRAFDWRRHEETHEPQELWLCIVCNMNNPFLVNRKDKFLKHVSDKHRDHVAEKLLDDSKLAFVPDAVLACPICKAESDSWDERCRHVLGHFEDEVEKGMKRVRLVREEEEEPEPAHSES